MSKSFSKTLQNSSLLNCFIGNPDVIESFVRSSGPGGQNVNKVATAVVLVHRPTGLVVKCQKFRTQFLNRQEAWKLLQEALREKQEKQKLWAKSHREKIRRQNRKRSRTAKERVLENKRIQSSKKQIRKKIKDWE